MVYQFVLNIEDNYVQPIQSIQWYGKMFREKGAHVQEVYVDEGGDHITFQTKKYREQMQHSLITRLLEGRKATLMEVGSTRQ